MGPGGNSTFIDSLFLRVPLQSTVRTSAAEDVEMSVTNRLSQDTCDECENLEIYNNYSPK